MNKKRLIAGLTSLVCCAGMLSLMPATVSYAAEIVHNDFEVTYEGWHGTNMEVSIEAVNGIGYGGTRGMLVSGRKSAQDGAEASKGLYLVGDIDYKYSVWVSSDTDETFHLMLTCDDMDTQESTTIELDTKNVTAGEWTEMGANFKAPKNSCEFRLTIITESENDFVFDELNVTTMESKKAD
ncbi:MAG: carbohydrate binding domain-containing protein, partial [Oscillospiraceae bacterium]|nr:carbohydrate binding domain-containing protein [Oscillospiraceae bacterium]